ncbi:MAG: hypothetical protein HY059_10030 [Proteobacteria bacterium]|nr:hypothetical protein [Pseudomonadota bacterium]
MIRLGLLAALFAPAPLHAMGRLPPLQELSCVSSNRQFFVVITPCYARARHARPRENISKLPEMPLPEADGSQAAPPGPFEPVRASVFRRKAEGDGYALQNRFELVNEVSPVQAMITDDGRYLVTLDDHQSMQRPSSPNSRDVRAALVVYAVADGQVKVSRDLRSLFAPDVLEQWATTGPVYWSEDARITTYALGHDIGYVDIELYWGQKIRVHLADGDVKVEWRDPALRPEALTENKVLALLEAYPDTKIVHGFYRFLLREGTGAARAALKKRIETPVDPEFQDGSSYGGAVSPAALRSIAMKAYAKIAGRPAVPYFLERARLDKAAFSDALNEIRALLDASRPPGAPAEIPEGLGRLLRERLEDPDMQTRRIAAQFYVLFRMPDAVEVLQRALARERDEGMRRHYESLFQSLRAPKQAPGR